jgi:cell division protein FtsW
VRLLGFLDPSSLYQVNQSLTALGIGGWSGVGLGGSVQKLRFLPEPHTDFILAIVGEELGFVGCIAVLALFAACLGSGLVMVLRFRDLFSFLVGAGILISISFQAVFNVAVVTASAPTKGIPLPFVTFGGSGLLVALAQVGILLALERENRRALAGELLASGIPASALPPPPQAQGAEAPA